MSNEIVVVGCGVIGLTCALVLVENGWNVKVAAKHFPSDPLDSEYTSPWAGAHFRPFPSVSQRDATEMKMTRETQRYFKKLELQEPESSIRFIKGVEYLEAPNKYYCDLGKGYTDEMSDFKRVSVDYLPEKVQLGVEYYTWVLNAPMYLLYLKRKLSLLYGVEFIRCELFSLKQAFSKFPKSIVVNATGRGLQYEGGYDPKVFLVRGQTLLLNVPKKCPYLNRTVTHQSKEGFWTFVIPRPLSGGLILGGTKQINDLDPSERLEDTKAIMNRARIIFPELFVNDEFSISNVNVGFRPAREGGSRIEVESIEKNIIVHAYGAGGMGYELSYGIALEVSKLIEEISNYAKL